MDQQVNVSRPSGAHRYTAPEARYGRSRFDLTHSHKTTYDAGYLNPYLVMEVLPGDTMSVDLDAFTRIFSPLDAPIMDDIMVEIDYFYVPYRILWEHWDEFLGASDTAGVQPTEYTIPVITTGGTVGDTHLARMMGVPNGLSTSVHSISALPFRAYVKIYNDWYRDQNLIDKVTELVDDGPDSTTTVTTFLKSAKKHDYFTTALPYLQKGDAVNILSGGQARVATDAALGNSDYLAVWSTSGTDQYRRLATDPAVAEFLRVSSTGGLQGNSLYVDLSVANITVNALREAEAVQRLLERDARGGTRLPELIRAHFGVDVPDFRVQRPEYLGGGRGFINVSPIANTSATATEDQGQLVGVGAGRLSGGFTKSFVEHGIVMGILRARGQVTYQQGLERMWTRGTNGKYDFLWPELVNLGEQPIYKKELFIENDATDEEVFGYTERYADYRFKKSLVTGKLNSDATGSLDFWHLAEDFAASPGLNQTFIEDATPMSRVTTVDDEPDFIIDGRFRVNVARVLPVRPMPSLAPPRM